MQQQKSYDQQSYARDCPSPFHARSSRSFYSTSQRFSLALKAVVLLQPRCEKLRTDFDSNLHAPGHNLRGLVLYLFPNLAAGFVAVRLHRLGEAVQVRLVQSRIAQNTVKRLPVAHVDNSLALRR